MILNKKELETVVHALIEERDRVVRTKGNQYGHMSVAELNDFITRLQNQRGA